MAIYRETLEASEPRRTVQETLLAALAVTAVCLIQMQPGLMAPALCAALVIVGVVRFEFLFYGIILLLPWQPLIDAGPPLRDPSLFLRFVLLGGVLVIRMQQGKSFFEWIAGSTPKKIAIAFAAIATISLFFASQPVKLDAYRSLIRLFSYLALFYAVTGYLEERRQVMIAVKLILLSTIAVALFGLFQVQQRDYTDLYFRLYPLQEDALEPWAGRVTSFLFHFNALAGYLNLTLPLAIVCTILHESRRLRIVAFACHTLGLAALYLTGSRGGLIAYGGMLLTILWFISEKRRVLLKLALSVALSMAIAVSLQERQVTAVRAVEDFDQQARLAAWAAAGMMFAGHPVLGVGFGSYRSLYGDYIPGARPDELDSHNLYLQFLAETGLIGFIVFCSLMFAFSRRAIQLARQPDPFARIIGIGAGGALAATLIHGGVDYLFNVSPQFGALFWLLPGLVLVTLEQLGRECAPIRQEAF